MHGLHSRAQLPPVPDAGRPVTTAADHQLLLSRLNLHRQTIYPQILPTPVPALSYACIPIKSFVSIQHAHCLLSSFWQIHQAEFFLH